MRNRKGWGTVAAGLLLVVGGAGCGADGADGGERSSGSTTSSREGDDASALRVDPALPPESIRVDGVPEVGETLELVVSSDLAGSTDIGWHQCFEVPSCLTLTDADGSSTLELAERHAWQVLRVIVLAGDASGETVVGPVVNPSPKPFTDTVEVRVGTGAGWVVAPGPVTMVVDADCAVGVVAGIKTSVGRESEVTDTVESEPATHHELHLDGGGGQSMVALAAEPGTSCDGATVRVEASR